MLALRVIGPTALCVLLVAGCAADPKTCYFEEQPGCRRQALEQALWRPALPYSRSLLDHYALSRGGWDALRQQDLRVAPFGLADAEALATGVPLGGSDLTPPPDVDALIAEDLGRWAFHQLPMRYDPYVDLLAARPDRWQALGLELDGDAPRGLIKYDAGDGRVRVGMTCAFCHASGGKDGRANRALDLGRARIDFAEATGVEPNPRFATWGPGRVDVTDDATSSPTAIPDLWGVKHASYINHSGVINGADVLTLAIRFETQIVLGHRMGSRPDRRLVWALANYVYRLEPPQPTRAAEPADRAVFERRCGACHDASRGYAGDLIPADALVSDPSVAETAERGTGYYKVPALVGVGSAAPYLHDGSQPTLESLLASGHPRGAVASPDERAALIRFMKSL